MVGQVMSASVAEVVCTLVAWMMAATDCGTTAEMVTVMVSRMKTGRPVLAHGGVLGTRQAGTRMSAQSAEARRRSSPATPGQT